MYLLDTNVISELRKVGDGRADPQVTKWITDRERECFHLSIVTTMELEIGIFRVERRDAAQGAILRVWMRDYAMPEFADRTLPLDNEIALRCAQLHVPDPRSERDAWIAATALVRGFTVVTRNVADFNGTGAKLINPWEVRP